MGGGGVIYCTVCFICQEHRNIYPKIYSHPAECQGHKVFELSRTLCFWSGFRLHRRRTLRACDSSNCDTNAHIKFIFDKAIEDLEWKNRIDFGENPKTEMAVGGHFVKMMKKLVHAITSPKMHQSTLY